MAEIDLKAYTCRARELESAIYTQKRLMTSHEAAIKEQHPKAPQKSEIKEPAKPELHKVKRKTNPGFIFAIILMLFAGVCGLFGLFIVGLDISVIVGLVFGIMGGICTYSELDEKKANDKLDKIAEDTYKQYSENYPILLEEYRKEVVLANEEYQKLMNGYNISVSKYNQRYSEIMEKHHSALTALERALEQLYNEGIIFPKYRNLVAITAINEYLLSGRCDKLEGPDGAYNLYEMELRQNIIIGQLSNIIDNLEQIKNNQFTLYQELQRSNNIINEILSETRHLSEDTKLVAYFTGVTALAETSPKYYHGIIM